MCHMVLPYTLELTCLRPFSLRNLFLSCLFIYLSQTYWHSLCVTGSLLARFSSSLLCGTDPVLPRRRLVDSSVPPKYQGKIQMQIPRCLH